MTQSLYYSKQKQTFLYFSHKHLFIWIYLRTFAPHLRNKHRGVEQLVARWAHNPKVVCSSQASATTRETSGFSFFMS